MCGLRRISAICAGDVAAFAASLEPGFVVVTGNGSLLSRVRRTLRPLRRTLRTRTRSGLNVLWIRLRFRARFRWRQNTDIGWGVLPGGPDIVSRDVSGDVAKVGERVEAAVGAVCLACV